MKSFFLAALLLLVANLGIAKEEEEQFDSMADAHKSFVDRKLCFIGILEDYTDAAGKEVDPNQDIVEGVRFSILWSAVEPRPVNYWMHICFEPNSGEIFGERKKTYAVTLEGGAKFGDADVNAWPECAWAFKFTPITIKQAPAVTPKLEQPQIRPVEGGAGQSDTRPASDTEGSDKPQPDTEGRSQ